MFNFLVKPSSKLLTHFQSVRHSRKTFRVQHAYGIKPILTQDEHVDLEESDRKEELAFQRIRFAFIQETNSPLYDPVLDDFCDYVLKRGNRALAYRLMDDTMYNIKSTQLKKLRKRQELEAKAKERGETVNIYDDEQVIETNPLVIFKTALKNIEPMITTKRVKRGGAIYDVPYPLSQKQSHFLACKWLISSVLERPKPRLKKFDFHMMQEILDAYLNRGKVIKKRDDIHRLADANKAYAHYRWG